MQFVAPDTNYAGHWSMVRMRNVGSAF